MKIACMTTSKVPSRTANSIQVMKACHALKQVDGEVCLWVPKVVESNTWEELAVHYGLSEPFEVRWVPVVSYLRRYDLSWRSLKQARKWEADIIYTWNLQVAVFALYSKIPVILEMHGPPTGIFGPSLFKQFLNFNGQKRLLVITEALRKQLENNFNKNLSADWVQISPNGTDLEHYEGLPEPTHARKLLSIPEKLTAAYTGHFYAGRGILTLLDLAKNFPEVNFLWIGGNPEDVDYWQKRLSDEGVNNVILTGFIDKEKLPLYQAAAEILLMPYESVITGSSGGNFAEICSPMKMFDYMAAGRAILTSDLPVIGEVLNTENAVLCPTGDKDTWNKSFKVLVDNPDLRMQLGLKAKQDVRQYSWRSRAEKALAGFPQK